MTDWSGYIGLILQGALVTMELTVMGSALAVVMAFVAGLGRVSRSMAIRALATTYIEFFRGTSIFVQLFWVYFVLPFDAIPDMLAGIGFTDDMAVLMAALTAVRSHITPAHRLAARKALAEEGQ